MTRKFCDRCGAEGATKHVHVSVVVGDWHGDETLDSNRQRTVVVMANLAGQYDESDADAPDLCDSCRAHVLQLAANAMTPPEKEPSA